MSSRHPAGLPDRALFSLIDDPRKRAGVPAREITAAFLARLGAWQPSINAFLTVLAESALAQAAALDAVGPPRDIASVAGLVVGIKDDLDLAGAPCTVGSARLLGHMPQADAHVVRALREQGAVLVGKLLLSEFALGSTGDNAHFGPVRNPWNPERYAGGSSSGSAAAVAADLCIAALGSDAGGSIRIPAALCGVSGLRPSYGSVPSTGAHEITPSIETIGPIARSVTDLARVLVAIASPPRLQRDAIESVAHGATQPLDAIRVGLPGSFFFDGIDPEVASAVDRAATVLEQLGATVDDIDVRGAESTIPAGRRIIVTEAYAIHEYDLCHAPASFGEEIRERMLTGREVSGAQLARDIRTSRLWTREMERVFARVDVLLTPTVGFAARPLAGSRMIAETAELSRLTIPFSLYGGPSLSMPCGLTSENLPIGVQLAAAPGQDDLLLTVGAAYQAATDWHRRRPPTPSD